MNRKKPGNVAGIILAGGRSSRMGQNKALLKYKGLSMIEHMQEILGKTGVKDVLISGTVPGYEGIPDREPFSGPAEAMRQVLSDFPDYAGFLFVPVDMPLLTADVLSPLMHQPDSAYYRGYPLPTFIRQTQDIPAKGSVREFLGALAAREIDLPDNLKRCMKNMNTPDEWQKVG